MDGDIGLHRCDVDILDSWTLCLAIFDGMWLRGSVTFATSYPSLLHAQLV